MDPRHANTERNCQFRQPHLPLQYKQLVCGVQVRADLGEPHVPVRHDDPPRLLLFYVQVAAGADSFELDGGDAGLDCEAHSGKLEEDKHWIRSHNHGYGRLHNSPGIQSAEGGDRARRLQ